MRNAIIVSDPMDSIVEYECPECGSVYSLEPDAGKITCDECGEEINCDVVSCLEGGDFEHELIF